MPSQISIHALLAESDSRNDFRRVNTQGFLSTLSLRRATSLFTLCLLRQCNFYPRSPCGERQANSQKGQQEQRISIHALLAESDTVTKKIVKGGRLFLSTLSLRRATTQEVTTMATPKFLSTLSLRRATARRASRQQPAGISIHALLAESDTALWRRWARLLFLSTLSLRRATQKLLKKSIDKYISIHALLAESDSLNLPSSPMLRNISIHALLAESDHTCQYFFLAIFEFLSTLSLRRATYQQTAYFFLTGDFYPRSPCGERL